MCDSFFKMFYILKKISLLAKSKLYLLIKKSEGKSYVINSFKIVWLIYVIGKALAYCFIEIKTIYLFQNFYAGFLIPKIVLYKY